MPTVPQIITRAAADWPSKRALIFDRSGATITFSEVEGLTAHIASGLQSLEVRQGDKVALMLPNVPAFPLSWLALSRLGAIMVPMNYGYKASDAKHILNQSETKVVITTQERVELFDSLKKELEHKPLLLVVDESVDSVIAALQQNGANLGNQLLVSGVNEETLLNIQYTSGTTGLPKGCMLSHGYWYYITHEIISMAKLTRSDTILTAQPFSYVDPQWNTLASLLTGAALVVLDRFSPSVFWEKVAKHDVTFFYCLGAMPSLLLTVEPNIHERNHKVTRVLCSGIPAQRHQELEERFSVPWRESYGSTETGADLWVQESSRDHLLGSGCIGTSSSHREVRIVDDGDRPVARGEVGELVVRGLGMMDGYYKNDTATQAAFRNGWFHSGDLALQNVRGEFFLKGRKKDMIRRAGENIAAVEVEQVLQQHELIKIAACVAIPDELRGEEVKAFILPAEGISPEDINPEVLIEYLEGRLARFKIPRYWETRSTLPMTPSERVAKHLLSKDRSSFEYDRVHAS